jgi:uracil phosphoribosyltransferase
MARIRLKAADLDGYLSEKDKQCIDAMMQKYEQALSIFPDLTGGPRKKEKAQEKLISLYNDMGKMMRDIIKTEDRLHVYSFETPQPSHGEASRLIAKLRDVRTGQPEFIYYIQRAYELLFNFAFTGTGAVQGRKNYIVVNTPVDIPVPNYAVHKVPSIDRIVADSVMCVMLRGALLPSMILSKEIQEYSSNNYLTPFALFKISRDDTKSESNMEYILDLDRSYFDLELLDGKDLFFADPMNATGGSLVTVVKYLLDQGVKPRSVKFFNVVSVLTGALRIARAVKDALIYTLWVDPALNRLAYIMPGLGDAGDRINGTDQEENPRNIIQLIACYGSNIASLYRDQLREIEWTVLGR